MVEELTDSYLVVWTTALEDQNDNRELVLTVSQVLQARWMP